MRSRGITVITVIGVLASGSAAMAINADTFGSSGPPNGDAATVLVPGTDTTTDAPEPSATPSNPADDQSPAVVIPAPPAVAPAPVPARPESQPAPQPKPRATTGSDDYDDEDEHEEEDDHGDEDEHEEEDD